MRTKRIKQKVLRSNRRRRGAVLVEFAMIIPFLATIIGLTFFFGWAMTNQHRLRTSSRYSSWRYVRTKDNVIPGELNSMFFAERARDIDISTTRGPTETLAELIDAAGLSGAATQQLASAVIWNRCPRGRAAEVEAEFPSNVGLWQMFQGKMRSYHIRDGLQWRRIDNVNCSREVRDTFLEDLDGGLFELENSGSLLAAIMRRLYLDRWRAWRP